MLFMRKTTALPSAAEALPGRAQPIPTASTHFVNGRKLVPPYPAGKRRCWVDPALSFGTQGPTAFSQMRNQNQISGGFGINTVGGGGGTNVIAFDRSRDTHVSGGGNDIARMPASLKIPNDPFHHLSAAGYDAVVAAAGGKERS